MADDNLTRKEKLGTFATISGAVAAAFAAAACCLGPLIVAAMGVGGAGAMVALAPYRPYFMVGTVLMLGLGFFMVYRKRPVVVTEGVDECGCDDAGPTKKRNMAKIMLWVATVVVVLFSASPYIIEATANASDETTTTSETEVETSDVHSAQTAVPQVPLVRVTIPVEGMDCASCGVAIQRGMDNVDTPYRDFDLDLEAGTVSFGFEGGPEQAAAFASSIRDIGYEVGEPLLLGSES